LRVLMMQGATRAAIVRGKVCALGALALLVALPAFVGLMLLAGTSGATMLPLGVILLGYAGWLLLWITVIVLVSMLVGRSRDALVVLVAIWVVSVVLLPRVAPDVASSVVPLQNRLQTEVAIARDLRRLGDAHNPNDPHFAAFKQSMLKRYGAARVEDLPVNYKGLLAMEGERITAALFDRYSGADYAAQKRRTPLSAPLASSAQRSRCARCPWLRAGLTLRRRGFLQQAKPIATISSSD
jgi:ABC-2 type transport system permease protein